MEIVASLSLVFLAYKMRIVILFYRVLKLKWDDTQSLAHGKLIANVSCLKQENRMSLELPSPSPPTITAFSPQIR